MKTKLIIPVLCALMTTLIACDDQNSPASIGEPKNAEAVDLGLSVKWANMNIGAKSPEDAGSYFAWGETKPKKVYSWDNYKYSTGPETDIRLTKYCTETFFGKVDNKKTLEPSDDAATKNWGSTWRIPTDDEWYELRQNCNWTWTEKNGVSGYLVTGSTGNSIFLAITGYYANDKKQSLWDGYYWSSTLASWPGETYARMNRIGSDRNGSYSEVRRSGLPIRPVRNK